MRKEFEKYFENLNRIWVLAKPHCSDADNEIEWLHLIQQNANETRELRIENDAILKKTIFCYQEQIESITEEYEAELFEFATELSHFSRQADIGVAYHTHLILLHYAEFHQDTDRIIRECYHIGLSLYYITLTPNLYGMNLYTEQISEYFKRAASYFPQLNTFSSKETRGYIVRSIANEKLAWPGPILNHPAEGFFPSKPVDVPYRRLFHSRSLRIFTDSKLIRQNPDLPWDNYLYAIHFGRTAMLSFLREKDDPELAQEVLESATYVYNRQKYTDKDNDQMFSAKVIYVYYAALYHAKQISIYKLVDTLLTEHEKADLDDWSTDGIYRNLNLMNYIRLYSMHCTPKEKAKLSARMTRADEHSWQYIRRLPLGEYLNVVTNFIRDMMSTTDNYQDSAEYRDYLLNYILACHQPTYVHSLMVAYLTREFCDRLITINPAFFVGIPDIKNISEVEINRTKILQLAYKCGLYHDIGKGAILNFVSIYGRNLFDEEFKILQTHPYLGYCTLSDLSKAELLEDCAFGHHKWYDNSNGYPDNYDTRTSAIKPIIDILSVADSVDAATDDIGRSYASAKKLTELAEELLSFSGTRYSPEVVKLFEDSSYLEEMQNKLKLERFHTYLVVYKDAQKNNNLL